MERPNWSKAVTGVLKSEATSSPARVVASYDRLIANVRESAREHVSEWELGEALNLRAMYLESRGRFREALAGHLAVAELRRGYLTSAGHGMASALEAAFCVALRLGRRKQAISLAREVLKLRGEYPYASEVLKQVVSCLAEEQKRMSDRARRQQLRRQRPSGGRARRRTRG
jgi:hypothetical protein